MKKLVGPDKRSFCSLAEKMMGVAMLLLSGNSLAGTLYWDTNKDQIGSGNAGGLWDSGKNWTTDPDGVIDTVKWQNGEDAVFSAGADGTGNWGVIVLGAVSPASITLRDFGAKTISGGSIHLGGGHLDTAAAGTSAGVTISSKLTGTGDITIAANGDTSDSGGGVPGNLALTGANDFIGDVVITEGVVTADSNFGHAQNKLVLRGGGIVDRNQNLLVTRDIEVPAGEIGIYRSYGSNDNARFTGALTGAGTIVHTDGGRVFFLGDMSGFSGTIRNARGDLVFTANGAGLGAVTFWAFGRNGNWGFAGPGVSRIKELHTDQDLYITNGSRLDILSGIYNQSDPGEFPNGNLTSGLPDLGTGELTSSSGMLTITNGDDFGNLGIIESKIRVGIVDPDSQTPLTLVKEHDGRLTLENANSYSGGSEIHGGVVTARHLQALGTGDVVVAGTGQLALAAAGSYPHDVELNGLGPMDFFGEAGALNVGEGANITGTIHVVEEAQIGGTGGTVSGKLTGAGDASLLLGPGSVQLIGDNSGFHGKVGALPEAVAEIAGLGGDLEVTAGTVTLTGPVAGSLSLGMDGTLKVGGSLTMAAPALQGGTLVVLAGATVTGPLSSSFPATVEVAGTVDGDVAIGAGDQLTLSGGTVTGNVTLAAGALIEISEGLTIGGDLSVNGIQTVTIPPGLAAGGPFVAFHYGGTFHGNVADFQADPGAGYRSVTFQHDPVAKTVTVDLGLKDLVWVGSEGVIINEDEPNWAGGEIFHTGDSITFDDSAEQFQLFIQGLMQPTAVTFDSSQDYTLTQLGGGFTGTTGITKRGPGRLALGGNFSDFTGPVAVEGGLLQMLNAESLGLATSVTIHDGAALDINGTLPGYYAGRSYTYVLSGTGTDGPGGTGALYNSAGGAVSWAGIQNVELAGDTEIGGRPDGEEGGRFDIGLATRRLQGEAVEFPGWIKGHGYRLTKVGKGTLAIRGQASDIHYVMNEGVLWFENTAQASGTNPIVVHRGWVASYGSFTFPNGIIYTNHMVGPGDRNILQTQNGSATWQGDFSLAGLVEFAADGGNLTVNGTISGTGTLRKLGFNQLILGKAPAWQGDTNLDQGTLQILAPGLSDTGILRVATGAMLVLSHNQQDRIGGLIVGGQEMPPGLYDAGNSSFISGTGSLLVGASPASAYDEWAAQIEDPGQRDRAADPDGDGLSNLEEFLFGGNPRVPDGALLTTHRSPAGVTLTWLQRAEGADYLLWQSETMASGSWSPAPPIPARTPDQGGVATGYERWSVTVPVDARRKFYSMMGAEK